MQPQSPDGSSSAPLPPDSADAAAWPVRPWYRGPQMWVELFALVNLAGMAPDIYLAHSTNLFRKGVEYVPLFFSLLVPLALVPAIVLMQWKSQRQAWSLIGHAVGWAAIVVGVAGMVLHLESHFFQEMTLASLVYTAPFAAPLAYAGLGLLLIMNRMVPAGGRKWAMWVLLLALGGFAGNFVFSLTDHAENGFFYHVEWVPVISSALAVGVLATPFVMRIGRGYVLFAGAVMLLQAVVGLLGFYYHFAANLDAPGQNWFERMVYGAPVFAPLLFPDLVLLAAIGLGTLYARLPESEGAGAHNDQREIEPSPGSLSQPH